MSEGFYAVKPQFDGQWAAIDQAEPSARRVLISEFIKALADWEAGQETSLERLDVLKRMASWKVLGQTVAEETARMVRQLGEEKAALRQGLENTNQKIAETEDKRQRLAGEVEALQEEFSIQESCEIELSRCEATLREQQAACEQLRACRTNQVELEQALEQLQKALQQGNDPLAMLSQLVTMRADLVNYYETYLTATQDIVNQIGQISAGGIDPSSDLLQLPDRLHGLNQELKMIDQMLAEHLDKQDLLDAEIKQRV